MSLKQRLQLHQFEINEDNILKSKLFVYKWPDKLLKFLMDNKDKFKLNIPIKNLSEVVTLVLDDVIYTRNKITEEKYWFFAIERINTKIVASLIIEWLNENKVNNLSFEDLALEDPIEINTRQLFEVPYLNDAYNVIPHLYNVAFCRQKVEIQSINRSLDFFPVIDTEKESTAISESLEYEDEDNNIEKFSYAITFRLVNNCEFPDKILLNVYTGVKVWAGRPLLTEKDNFISGKHANSFYFYVENDYTNNVQKKLIRLMYERDHNLGFKYKNFSDELIGKQLSLKFSEALKSPNDFNSFNEKGNGIYLITNYNKSESVKYGAGLPERLDISIIMHEIFPELIKRDLIPSIIGRGRDINKKKKSLKELEEFANYQDQLEFIEDEDKFFYTSPPILTAKNNKVIIEIYTKNQELVDSFIELSTRVLSLNMPLDKYTYQSYDGYEVTFVPKDDYICRELSIDELNNKKKRSEEIVNLLKEDRYDTCHILSLVDIYAFQNQDYETKKRDPKNLIRNILKDTGRVTQFINEFDSNEKNSKIKLLNATYDLFSAAGFLDYNYVERGFSDKVLLGLSAIENSRGKMTVLSKVEEGQVCFKIYGIWDNKWLSINEILPKLQWSSANKILKSDIDKNQFNEWIVKQLNDLQTGSKDCYFYFDASLRHKIWPFAANTKLDINKLRVIDSDRFKFIRVNTSNEVPEYNIYRDENDTVGINRNKGLFSSNNKVFYSVGSRPDSTQVKTTATRLTHTTQMITKQKIVEFVILNNDSDENIEIAIDSHILRKLNLTFDAATKYPLPIYLNQRFGEYLDSMGLN